jgi:hypothetical protein
MVQQAFALGSSPASAAHLAVRLRGFSTERTSRYSRGDLPPALTAVCGMLTELTEKHREYPGAAIRTKGIDLKGLLRNEAGGIEPGKADDYIRALENMAILIEVELGGETVTLFDRERMEQLIAFSDGAGSFAEPTEESVLHRARDLIEIARIRKNEGPKTPLSEPSSVRVTDPSQPEFEDALLALDEAKQTISVGKAVLKDVVVDPLDVLKRAFPKARVDRLETHVFCGTRDRYLTPLSMGEDVYHFALEPRKDGLLRALVPGVENELSRALEARLAQIDLDLRKLSDRVHGERARQSDRSSGELSGIGHRFNAAYEQRLSEINLQLASSVDQLMAESERERVRRLDELKEEFRNKESAINADVDARLTEQKESCTQDAVKIIDAERATLELQLNQALEEAKLRLEAQDQAELSSLEEQIRTLRTESDVLKESLKIAKR